MEGMRFTEISELAVEPLLVDPLWVMEQKMDGTRGLAHLRYGMLPVMTSGHGDPLKHTAATQHLADIWEALASVQEALEPGDEVVLDGEVMIHTGEYRVFDLPRATMGRLNRVMYGDTYEYRRSVLRWMFTEHAVQHPVSPVRTAVGEKDKRALLEAARLMGVEGVMLKHVHSVYRIGERVKDIVKLKFVRTADVVVLSAERGRNEAGREVGSAQVGVRIDPRVKPRDVVVPIDGLPYVRVGACSLIGKPEVRVGDVIEVAYLYWTGQSLYQPRLLRVRDDKPREECEMAQFAAYTREVVR